jgi:hypothetical protein
MLEVRFFGMPGASREAALAVTNVDQMPEQVAGIMSV